MNKSLCWSIVLYPCICFKSLGESHSAYAGFRFYNSLDKKVELNSEILMQDYKPEGFQEFETQEIDPNAGISFEENLTKYEEVCDVNDSQVMLKINVSVINREGEGTQKVGAILLLRGISPDPCFCFKNLKNDLGIKLRIKRSRFGGGGLRTIEVVRTTDF